jgi:hypothetical protein
MKKATLIYSLTLALALPVFGLAQDKADPGKAGDAVKNPAPTAPGRAAEPARTANDAEPGKSGTAVKTPNPAGVQHQFSGAITAVSRDEKTITINEGAKVSHKLQIGDTTKLRRGDRDGTWEDLKIGAQVQGTCSGGEETSHAETINING